MMYRLLEVTSLGIFAFGALTFSTLALFYWGERRRGKSRQHTVFPAFTLICAIAFLNNLLFQTPIPQSAGPWLAIALLRSQPGRRPLTRSEERRVGKECRS